jgi:predicted anti-sigma-YlaC factor YlaD
MSVRGDVVCRELVELLTDYLEDAIPAEDRAVIDAHLADCDGCTNVLDQLRRTIRITGTLTAQDVPAAQRDALLAVFRTR